MIVKTRKYQLPKNTYIKHALKNILMQQWWVFLIVLAIAAGYFWIPNLWWIFGALIGLILYWLFWLIQFAGVTQMEQTKLLFEKLSYEITSQQILIKLSAKQGMPIKWDQIKRAKVGKAHFLLVVNKAQLIYLPHKIFNSDYDRKFIESILKRKGYIS